MKPIYEPGPFQPTLSRIEAKNDVTSRAAREIIARERAARIAKTERLRAARLAQEDAARTETAEGAVKEKR